jgi:hypothetical protein
MVHNGQPQLPSAAGPQRDEPLLMSPGDDGPHSPHPHRLNAAAKSSILRDVDQFVMSLPLGTGQGAGAGAPYMVAKARGRGAGLFGLWAGGNALLLGAWQLPIHGCLCLPELNACISWVRSVCLQCPKSNSPAPALPCLIYSSALPGDVEIEEAVASRLYRTELARAEAQAKLNEWCVRCGYRRPAHNHSAFSTAQCPWYRPRRHQTAGPAGWPASCSILFCCVNPALGGACPALRCFLLRSPLAPHCLP